jgi:hypothetical protein
MNSQKRKFSKADVVPFVVLCLCLLNFFTKPVGFLVLAMYLSIWGLVSVIIYQYARHLARVLFVVWAAMQLILIRNADPAAGSVLDLSQGVSLPVYLPLTLGGDGYQVGINMGAVILLVLMEFLRSDEIIGEYLQFAAYRCDNYLGDIFPLKGKVERQVCLSGEKDWLLVNLRKPFQFNQRPISYVLIKRNDKRPVTKNLTNQLVFFKPVADVSVLNQGETDINNFKDEVWALCK